MKKFKYSLLLAIISVSTVVAAFAPFQNASAAVASLYLAPEIKKDAIASAYRVSLALCTTWGGGNNMNSNGGSLRGKTVSQGDISSGKWFYQGNSQPELRPGYLVDDDDGRVECRNFFGGRDVAKALGWDSNTELACGIGYERENGSNCLTGGGDFTTTKTSKNEIFDKIAAKYKNSPNSGPESGYTAVQTYLMAAHTYITTCNAKPVINLDDANYDQQNADDLQRVKVVTGTGNVVEVLYRKGNNDEKNFKNADSFDQIYHNCDWMKDRMNDNAAAYAAYVKTKPAEQGDQAGPGTGDAEKEPDTTTCKIDYIGWILCPALNFLAKISDTAYSGVELLLEVKPLSVNTSQENGAFNAWSAMRDIANVAFVVAFMIIVFSQVTNIGINNYGIKKMLPKLILAAILVNTSYWICAIAIDISNIVGSSLKDILEDAGKSAAAAHTTDWASGTGWQKIVGSVIAGAVAVAIAYATLASLIPALITVAIAIAAVLVVLSVRQALIILWVVSAPIAFVAYLLPNTEKIFKFWFNTGKTLLLLYAIVALLFGASSLASVIVMNSSTNIIVQIMGGLISVVPLLATPFLIKTSAGLAGKIGAFVNNPNKGPFDSARKRAEQMGDRIRGRRQIDALEGNGGRTRRFLSGSRGFQRQTRREAVNASIGNEVRRGQAGYLATQARDSANFRNQLAGGTRLDQASQSASNRALAGAISTQQKLEIEEVNAATATLRELNLSGDQLQQLSMGQSLTHNGTNLDGAGNFAVRVAAMQRVVDSHDVTGVNRLLDNVSRAVTMPGGGTQGPMDERSRLAFANALSNSRERPGYVGQGAIANIRQHGSTDSNGNLVQAQTSTQLAVNAVNNNTYSVDRIANGDREELQYVAGIAADAANGTDNRQFAGNAAAAMDPNGRYAGQVGKNRGVVETISNLPVPPTPTPPTPPTP